MGKIFRPSNREAKLLSKIESSKERARRLALENLRDCVEQLSNSIAMGLVDAKLVETTNKNSLEEQIAGSLDKLTRLDDFDIDYKVAPFRHITSQPNVITLYVTAYVIETIIDHKDTVDIYGSDEEIYVCINKQVLKHLPF